MIYLHFDKEIQPVSIKIAWRAVVPTQNSKGLTISIVGRFSNDADLELTFKAQSGVALWIIEIGLAACQKPRPAFVHKTS